MTININGQDWCYVDWNAAHDGSSGAIILRPGTETTAIGCSTVKTNPGTFNVTVDTATHSFAFTNNTGSGPLTFWPTIKNGGW